MTTTIETFLADIRYFSALDPYNWQVDNRPLSDLEDSINTLASGLESAINASKLNALVAGLIHQTIVGRARSTGYAFQPSNLVWRIERSITNGWITDDGKEVATIAVQVTPQNFVFSAPSAGQKKLILIKAIYEVPNDTDLPYYDETQTLDAASTGFNSLVSKVGVATLSVVTNTVALADPDNYPSTSPGEIPLFHIRIDAGDTTLNKVHFQNFTQEGQSIQYATTTEQGQVKFATSQEVIDRSTTTVISPSTSASIAIDELANLGLGIESPTKPALVLTSGDLNSVITPAKKRYFTSGVANIPFPSGIVDVENEPLLVFQFARSTDGVQMATRTSGDSGVNWTAWTYFAKRNGDPSQTFKVATAVANDDAVRLEQLTSSELWGFNYISYSVGSHTFTIPANKVIRVLLIGGGGGGGGIANADYTGASSGSDGNASSIYPTGNASAFFLKANGGKAGNGVTTSNGSAGVYGTHGVPREVEINSLYEVVILSYQDGLLPINHATASEIKHPTIKKLALTSYGKGGLGGSSGHGISGSGSGGAFVEALIKNNSNAPLDLTIEVGAGGASSTGNYSNGQNGGHGICVVIY